MKFHCFIPYRPTLGYPGEHVDKLYTCSKAADVRDAMAKALYARLFQWMVSRLNSYLQPPSRADHLHIGTIHASSPY